MSGDMTVRGASVTHDGERGKNDTERGYFYFCCIFTTNDPIITIFDMYIGKLSRKNILYPKCPLVAVLEFYELFE